jgi:DNA-binding beta-propeller fold protein YncE
MGGGARRKKVLFQRMRIRMARNAAFALNLIFFTAGVAAGLSGADPVPAPKRLAYVSNLMSHTVSVIDLDRGVWLRDLDLGRYPIFSSLHPRDATKMILALHNYDRKDDEDLLVLVDLKTEKIIKRAAFPGAGIPSGFAYDLKRDRIYIADENLHRVFALDGLTLEILFEFPAGLVPVHVAISPDCRWLVSTNRKSANLYLYDLDDPKRAAKEGICVIPLGPAPGLAWDPDASGKDPFSHPVDVKFGADSRTCYVTDYNTRSLLAVDTEKREVVARVAFDKTPFDLTLNGDRTVGYVCLIEGDAISVVDLEKMKPVAEITGVGPQPIHCELDEERGQLVVACWGGYETGGIRIVDLKTRKIVKSVDPAGAKASIGITIAKGPD